MYIVFCNMYKVFGDMDYGVLGEMYSASPGMHGTCDGTHDIFTVLRSHVRRIWRWGRWSERKRGDRRRRCVALNGDVVSVIAITINNNSNSTNTKQQQQQHQQREWAEQLKA